MSRLKNYNLTITDGTSDDSSKLSEFDGNATYTIDTGAYLYLGFKKPIHTIYFDVETPNTNTNLLTVEKYDSVAADFATVDRQDNTQGFIKSGFIYMEDVENEVTTTINSIELYWVRISTTTTISTAIDFRYINIVFCDEKELYERDTNVKRMYPVDVNGDDITTHLSALMSARDWVIKKINQSGKKKYVGINVSLVNQWDIFHIEQVNEMAKDYALYVIYDNVNDSVDEYYEKQARKYLDSAEAGVSYFKTSYLLELDTDDDGYKDTEEIVAAVSTQFRYKK